MYRTITIVTILTFLIGMLNCACNNVQTKASTHYEFKKITGYIRYLDELKELQAELTFKTDSAVAIKGAVKLNQYLLNYKQLPKIGIQYRMLKRGIELDSSFQFSYEDLNGSIIEIPYRAETFKDVQMITDGLSISKGAAISWRGNALEGNDGMVLILSDEIGNNFSIHHAGITRGTKFEINKSFTSGLSKGKGTLRIIRKKTTTQALYDNPEMVLINYEHYLKPIHFEIKE